MATIFIGYTTGVISKGMEAANLEGAPITIFLSSLPFHFFSYVSILIALLSLMPAFNFSRMKELMEQSSGDKGNRQTKKINTENRDYAFEFSKEMDENEDKADTAKDQMGVAMKGEKKSMKGMKMGMENDEPALKPRLLNLVIPIVILIPLSFILMWNSENPSRMMLLALMVTIVGSVGLYLIQGLKLKTVMDRFIKGGNKLMTTIIILVLAWPISDVSQDLGLTTLIEGTLAGTITPVWIPLIVFLVTAIVTYFIGSSWGSWALMMPVAIPLAVTTGSSIPLVVAAVFSGGIFGDVTSPVSGMTAMSAGITNADHMKYVRAMTPYNMTAAALSAVLFLAVSL
jgi:Na+/H+ antiporter NhaC